MAPNSRSNSRPPLTSRIRASFEGKRIKPEVTSPVHTNGNGYYPPLDPEALQTAVDQAINGETFQLAIAANLARLIKPSIRDALDTLQPVVEAVYSHEVLLRKTNRSVEDILIRLDTGEKLGRGGAETPTPTSPGTPTSPRRRNSSESSNPQDIEQFKQSLEKNNKRTVATLAELSSAVNANNKKINEVVTSISDIQATLVPTRASVDSLQAFVDQSPTTTAVLQAQLDQLKEDIGLVIDTIGSNLGQNVKDINQKVGEHASLFASHAAQLDAISTDLVALKGQPGVLETIQAISGDLETIKGKVEDSIISNHESFGALESQVGTVLNAVETHSGTLTEIKDANAHPEILAAVQKSNDSHASHSTLLSEIKDRSLSSDSERALPVSGSDPEFTTLLQALKEDLLVIKENVESGLSSNSDSLTGISSKLDNVFTTVEEHKSANQSADILTAVQKSNDSHTSHAEALEGIKSLGAAAPTADYNGNFAALEAQLASLQTSLQSHAGTLDDIKTANISTSREIAPVSEDNSTASLQAEIATIVNTLQSHTAVLAEIKEDVSAEILSTLHDIAQSQASSGSLLTEIKEADVSAEILTALHSSNDSHTTHTAALEQLHAAVQASNDSHAAHGTAFDELKSTRSIDSAVPAETSSPNALEANISALAATLEETKATLAEIKQAANASNESHVAHTASLEELKSARSVEESPSQNVNLDALESQIGTIAATLDEHKTTLSAIHEAAKASNESHAAHTAVLVEIKEAAGSLTESHALHHTALGEIKDATTASNESHAAHTATLAEIKSTPQPETSTRDDPASADVPALEAHFNTIISSLEAQNSTLSDIKEATTNPELLAATKETHGLVTLNHELLTSHTPLLESIQAGISHEDISSNISELKSIVEQSKAGVDDHSTLVKDLHTDTKNSHSELTLAIGALALGGAAGAGAAALTSQSDDSSSSEILSEVKAVRALVETSSASIDTTKETVTSIASQIDINHTTVTTTISTLSDELKAEIDATGTQVADSVTGLSGIIQAIDVDTLNGAVQECNKDVKEITVSIEALGSQVQTTGDKVDELAAGVHLNEKGLGQLKEHTVILNSAEPISEGAWLRSTAAPEVAEIERSGFEESDEDDAYRHNLSPVAEEQTPQREDTPVLEDSEVEEPAVEEVAVEEPAAEEPAVEEPTVEEPAVEDVAAIEEDSVLAEPAEKETAEEIAAEEPPVEEPVAEEAAAKELATEEPATVESVAEDPTAEEPISKEPAAEESVAKEEAAAEEPVLESSDVAEEPATEDVAVVKEQAVDEAEEPVTMADNGEAEEPIATEELAPEEEAIAKEPVVEEAATVEEPATEAHEESAHADAPVEDEAEEPLRLPKHEATTEDPAADDDPASEQPATKAPAVEEEESPLADPEPAAEKPSDLEELPTPATQPSAEALEADNTGDGEETESASTSAIASPSSPAFPPTPGSSGGKKGKKGKKEKKEKKEKKGKKEKVQFVMDGDEPEE
ncbi:uncharacterized protein BP5553_06316 [Venustampulla echinocandica]|uniref:Uncharacterized protein n=1 Tax=Venustampulla echinocandica TaxID=2656787 RepID=A0A370TJK1_9HELO|nr:uncharacterized protein BP5553_06316 [Venustampulla echinocandica]RDL35704.1 hypothetical protein BP5553_06316 [Venustampulla echinocandica]